MNTGLRPSSIAVEVGWSNESSLSTCVTEDSPTYHIRSRHSVRLDCSKPILGDTVKVTIQEADTFLNLNEVLLYGRSPGKYFT